MPGEYVFNVHLYRKRRSGDYPIPVTVLLEKLNPHVRLLYSTTVELKEFWEEKTIIRFILDVDGEVTESYFLHKPLVEKIIGRREGALMGHWEQQPPGPAGPASHPHGPPLNEDKPKTDKE